MKQVSINFTQDKKQSRVFPLGEQPYHSITAGLNPAPYLTQVLQMDAVVPAGSPSASQLAAALILLHTPLRQAQFRQDLAANLIVHPQQD